MKKLKYLKQFNESTNPIYDYLPEDEEGKLLLYFNNEPPTTWFYFEDAIINGILDEKLQLTEYLISEIGQFAFYEELTTASDLAIWIEQDPDSTFENLFSYLIENDLYDHHPTIKIIGEDEKGESFDIEYK